MRAGNRGSRAASLLTAAMLAQGCATTPRSDTPAVASAAAASTNAAESSHARFRYIGKAMGARVEITIDEVATEAGKERARLAAKSALLELDRLDGVLSDWKRKSELAALNASADLRREMSADFRAVLARALEIAAATDGLFDPTVAPPVALWRESRASLRLPTEAERANACARVGWRDVSVDGASVVRKRADVALDFGGIGKGYGAIRALEVLRAAGCPRALVAVAGDIAAGDAPGGSDGWNVEIAPESAGIAAESITVVNAAVSTSGGSEQWVEIGGVRYAHIVDPRTGLGATDLAQVTVIGPLDCAVDALGTALALTHDDRAAARILAKFPGYQARFERHGRASWHGNRDARP